MLSSDDEEDNDTIEKVGDQDTNAATSDAKKDTGLLSTEMATDERHLSSNSDDVTASASAKNQLASVTREDAVDISLQDHVNEVTEDAVTNPVEQAKKRARTSPG